MGFYGEFIFEANGTEVTLHNFRDEISNDIFYSGIYGNYEGHSLELWNNLLLASTRFDCNGYRGFLWCLFIGCSKC